MTASKPALHLGIDYQGFMSTLSIKRDVRRYFEIGVNEGMLMSVIHATIAVGVDPCFVLTKNAAANKKQLLLFSETSDRFFASYSYEAIAGGKPELCFLDGLHTFDCLLRDFINTEAICSPKSLVCMHDCLPLDDVMTNRVLEDWRGKTVGTRYENYWTGDVWKILPILKKYRPDLRVVALDCPPTGVVCITNLDPNNTVLSDRYLDIVEEFSSVGNAMNDIERLYENIDVKSSHAVLKQYDNTLFFKV